MLPLLLVVGGEATALERHDSMDMTCAEAKSALQSDGKALLYYTSKKGMPRYGMFVGGRQMCKMQQIAIRGKMPTSDNKSCIVVQCSQYGHSIAKY
jgi:hypothetical protein